MPAEGPRDPVVHTPDTAVPTTVVIWVNEGPVCVGCEDLPPACSSSGVCHCPSCHATLDGDQADDYFQFH